MAGDYLEPLASVVRYIRCRGSRHRPTRIQLPETGRIFGIGLSRTGTTSLTSALEMLSIRSVHFPADTVSRTEVMAFLSSGASALHLSILDEAQAIADTPVCTTFEALDRAYPGSKFIFTVRAKESWLNSCETFWRSVLEPFAHAHRNEQEGQYMEVLCNELYGGLAFDRDRFASSSDAYNRRVETYFSDRAHDVLVLRICEGEGWNRLCRFLGCAIPGSQFPWSNARTGGGRSDP